MLHFDGSHAHLLEGDLVSPPTHLRELVAVTESHKEDGIVHDLAALATRWARA